MMRYFVSAIARSLRAVIGSAIPRDGKDHVDVIVIV